MAGIGWAPLGGEWWTWRWCVLPAPMPGVTAWAGGAAPGRGVGVLDPLFALP
jgi:hypothetical protein